MAKRNPETAARRGKLRELIKERDVKTIKDVHNVVKTLTSETIQTAFDAEFEQELGYSKYDCENKNTGNSRDGLTTKQVQGSFSKTEISVPQGDRAQSRNVPNTFSIQIIRR